jgi:hypothetical protein
MSGEAKNLGLAYTMNYTQPPTEVKGWRPLWINLDFLKVDYADH